MHSFLNICLHIQAKDRAITMKSIAHQADQVIRKLISAKLQELKGNARPVATGGCGGVTPPTPQ